MSDVLEPGPRDHLVTKALHDALRALPEGVATFEDLDAAEAPVRLAQHLAQSVTAALRATDDVERQADDVNRTLLSLASEAPDAEVLSPPRLLTGILERNAFGQLSEPFSLPATPLSQSDLLVNAVGQPNIGSELRAELQTAKRVDLICAFVIWSGVVQLAPALEAVVRRGGEVRVITTTYMGATEKRAVDELVRLGAQVKVALDARTTKLHAKAWLLERSSGMTTAFIGSSNLSHTALFDGLEWNVRLSEHDAPYVVERVKTTFDSHWASEHFEPYDPAVNGEALERALGENDRRREGLVALPFVGIDVRPFGYQQRMLDALKLERDRHDRHRNLVVAATGTGKTVVAALDYRALEDPLGRRPSLLFVAHRMEILRQAHATYQHVLSDGSFGEMHGNGRVAQGDHVFAMVQSLQRSVEAIDPTRFDVVVIDEFHHASAASYGALLQRLRPKELLGLTATPERLDGKDVTEWFGGRIAVELRLWEAIDQGFLVPFQYFGVGDETDLRSIAWDRGNYDQAALSQLYTGDDARVRIVLRELRRVLARPEEMRGLGFCVSVAHAEFMARSFAAHDLPAAVLSGQDSPERRMEVLNALRAGELRCVFSVDVLGEGVDVPDVDVVLLLRPTQSATLFTQQLGRGLRTARDKSHLTVIDLIGQHRLEFRFADRLRAILDVRRGPVREQVEQGFPFLPSGCAVQLDRRSEELVIDNLKEAARLTRWANVQRDLAEQPDDGSLAWFLERTGRPLEDVYRPAAGGWTALRRAASKSTSSSQDPSAEEELLRAIRRLRHIDDRERVDFYVEVLGRSTPPRFDELTERRRRLATMLVWDMWGAGNPHASVAEAFSSLWQHPAVRVELIELLAVLDSTSTTPIAPSPLGVDVPLAVHGRYTRPEAMAALGHGGDAVKPPTSREGILWAPSAQADVFFVDLHKSERDYSPSTMYRDFAISRTLFHWESQSRQAPGQPVVERYIHHRERGSDVLLMVRERKNDALGLTMPFVFLGPASYVSHRGAQPVQFTWELSRPMPEELFEEARAVAVA